jgi:hypothetical protein
VADAPDHALDRLYGLPLDAFVAERDALAKELRADGRRDEAAAVKALAKPTVSAWAVNQAVRSQPGAARELWEKGDALARAQRDVLAGKASGPALRAALQDERDAVEALVDAARGLMTSAGADLSETTIDRVRATLQAAALDADARDDVASGVVTRERVAQGLFGGDLAVAAPAPPARSRTRRAGKGEGEGATVTRKRDRERDEREEREAREREVAERKVRAREQAAAAKRVARAEKALAAAQARATGLEEKLAEARGAEAEAKRELGEAQEHLAGLDD